MKSTTLMESSLDTPSRSLQNLTPEILHLIFQELYDVEGSDGCKPVRLVSKTLCGAAVPFFFRDINFKPANANITTLVPFSVAFRSHLLDSYENIYTYARNARVDRRMNWSSVVACLSKCRQLERLDWAYWDDVEPNRSPIPLPIQDFLRTKVPRVRLYVWRFHFRKPLSRVGPTQDMSQYPHLSSIPTSNLAGLSMASSLPRDSEALNVLAKLLISSPNLETLEVSRMRGKFPGDRRLSPIKHLSMSGCSWPYTAGEVSRTWDFSKLETLRITDTGCLGRRHNVVFFQSVPPKSLPRLKKFTLDADRQPAEHKFMELLGTFLLGVPQLQEIDLTCDMSSLLITAITRHGCLRVLSLRDSLWTKRGGEVAGTIAIPDLELLQAACGQLTELTLDVRNCDVFPTLAIVSKFRNLRKVTLRVPTQLLQKGENDSSLDIDRDLANKMSEYLWSHKAGVPMEKMTVDIGCYNSQSGPHTSDRAAQRAQGLVPERLFIFSEDEARIMRFEEIKDKKEAPSILSVGLARWLELRKTQWCALN